MVVIIYASSAGPDEMQHYAAFHLGLQCLLKGPFRGPSIQMVNKQFILERISYVHLNFQRTCRSHG